eukprot:5783549-Amphidinium_carterae.1
MKHEGTPSQAQRSTAAQTESPTEAREGPEDSKCRIRVARRANKFVQGKEFESTLDYAWRLNRA